MFLADGDRAGFMGWAGDQSPLRGRRPGFARSVAAGRDPSAIAPAVRARCALGLTTPRTCLTGPATRCPPCSRRPSHRPARLPGQAGTATGCGSPPRVAVTGHSYALAARPRRGTARSLWALAAAMIVVFAAWPDALWESARNLGQLLWSASCGPSPTPTRSSSLSTATRPIWYWSSTHWRGFQLLWGDAYVLAGMALLVILLALAWRLARRGPAACAAARLKKGSPAPPIP